MPPDGKTSFDLTRLAEHPLVGSLEYRTSIGSTNTMALKLAADADRTTPALVLTERQTAGRGRGTHRWWAGPGALTFSLIVEPARWQIADRQLPQLSLTTAVAVCDVLGDLCPAETWQIKWPNDVVLGGRKICGILIEVPNVKPKRAILGVGLNVNNSWQQAPAELRTTGTTLCDVAGQCDVAGREFDLSDVLCRLLTALDGRLGQLGQAASELPMSELPAAWQSRCVLRGRHVEVETGQGVDTQQGRVRGTCRGIDDQGRLLVETPRQLKRLSSGTVTSGLV